jgi:hypothetical protein
MACSTSVGVAGPTHANHGTRLSLTDLEADLENLHDFTFLGRLHNVFRNTSCNSAMPMPANFFFQRGRSAR